MYGSYYARCGEYLAVVVPIKLHSELLNLLHVLTGCQFCLQVILLCDRVVLLGSYLNKHVSS